MLRWIASWFYRSYNDPPETTNNTNTTINLSIENKRVQTAEPFTRKMNEVTLIDEITKVLDEGYENFLLSKRNSRKLTKSTESKDSNTSSKSDTESPIFDIDTIQ